MRDAGLTHGGFYKHFGSKDELLIESVGEAFREIGDRLEEAGKKAPPGTAWKAMVNTYLSLEECDNTSGGCPLAALAPELARAEPGMKGAIVGALIEYKSRLLPWMPGQGAADRERAFFAIFSTMIGAMAIARLLPDRAARAKVLGTARDFLLLSF